MSDSWTITKLLDWATGYFRDKNIDSPRLDAEILLAQTLSLKRLDLYLQFDRPLTVGELATFKELVRRRAAHEPVAYITGQREFWSRDFGVMAGVLIPRPETEGVIQAVLDIFPKKTSGELAGFEVGVGSGAIAVTLLAELSGLTMRAIDVSGPALQCAKVNAERYNVDERLELLERDFLTQDNFEKSRYDFIVANPPYIASAQIQTLPPTVRDHEPHLALDGGADGLVFYRQLMQLAPVSLKNNGALVVEIGEDQGDAVKILFEQGGLQNVVVQRDVAGLDRVVVGRKN